MERVEETEQQQHQHEQHEQHNEVMVVAVPSEMLAQLVQNNTDLTRCITRLMEYLPTIPVPVPIPSPLSEDEPNECTDVNTCPYYDPSSSSTPSIIGTMINALVIVAIFLWFLDFIGNVKGIFQMY